MKTLWILAAAATFAACHNRSDEETGAAPDRGDTTAVSGYDTTATPSMKTDTAVTAQPTVPSSDTSMTQPTTPSYDTTSAAQPSTPSYDTTSAAQPTTPSAGYDTTSTAVPSSDSAAVPNDNDTNTIPDSSSDSSSTQR